MSCLPTHIHARGASDSVPPCDSMQLTPNPHSRTGCIRAEQRVLPGPELPTHIHARGASRRHGQDVPGLPLPTHIHAWGASMSQYQQPAYSALPTHIHARGASSRLNVSLHQPGISQPTFTHGVHPGARWTPSRRSATPNPHSRTGCITDSIGLPLVFNLPTHIHARGASHLRVWKWVECQLPTYIHARGASVVHLLAATARHSQPTFTHGVHRLLHLQPRGDRPPNPHSRTGCIGKTPQNMSRMYGIHIHNLYLIECCDRARFMEACQLRPASRFLGVESPMPMVRKHQQLMFASASPFLGKHRLSF